MNLETATPQQREVITTLDKPLMVAAGAGSGKTFTLTQRVVYALLPQGSSDSSYLRSIDEVLATTFTKKAAGELKSRIKNQLLAEGLVSEALKTDDAWVSTMHGICSRILRENAFLLNLDPAFEIIAEEDARVLMEQAFESVVNQARKENDRALLDLLDVYSIRANSNGTAVFEMCNAVIDKALATRKGFASINLPKIGCKPNLVLRQMLELGESFVDVANEWIKPNATDLKNLQAIEDALAITQLYLTDNPNLSFTETEFDSKQFLQVFYSFPKTSPKFRMKKEDAYFFEDYRLTYATLSAQVNQAIGTHYAQVLVRFASLVYECFQALKGSSLLDNTDQLRKAVWALETYPEIAQALRERFNLVMIDEFQDTDQLQVALLENILHEDGSNVCTVGDAQQSIYRFRGADVSVFHEFRDYVGTRFNNARFVNLPDNFRSHKDILSFVDFVFSAPQFFGEKFLSLNPRSAINDEFDPVFAHEPRIIMQVIDVQKPAVVADARRRAAQEIAQHFSKLRDRGVSPDEMVILLGSMSNVGCYADALQEAGFESIITGGSVFSKAGEIELMCNLLRVCANPFDSLALYTVLSSDMFAVSDATFLALATTEEEGRIKKQDIALGFMYGTDDMFTSLSLLERDTLHHARACIDKLCQESIGVGVVRALKHLFVSTGYFSRLEQSGAQGLATAGNIYKALDMISEFETSGMGASQIIDAFSARLAASKEAPGVLSTTSSSFVKIMTVHASKGLEFPHVALSELNAGTVNEELFCVEANQGITQISLKPKLSSAQKKISDELKALLVESENYQPQDDELSFVALHQRRAKKELEEAKRLLYVALTRASKSLFLNCTVGGNASFDYSKKGIIYDLKTVLGWNNDDEFQRISYGGTMPLSFRFIALKDVSEQADEKTTIQEEYYELYPASSQTSSLSVYENACSNTVSYSSLAKKLESNRHDKRQPSYQLHEGDFDSIFNLSESRDEALEFGRGFHRCAQKLVLEARNQEDRLGWLLSLDEAYITHLQRNLDFSHHLQNRLQQALEAWLSRDVLNKLLACEFIDAEVPFMVSLSADEDEIFLEGEIDALGINSNEEAFFVDYKTGGSLLETAEEVYQKHLLQAQCYAYALLREGFSRVVGTFIRVDFLAQDSETGVDSVSYSFDKSDTSKLKKAVLAAYAMCS